MMDGWTLIYSTLKAKDQKTGKRIKKGILSIVEKILEVRKDTYIRR